jgi:hypothetical protein
MCLTALAIELQSYRAMHSRYPKGPWQGLQLTFPRLLFVAGCCWLRGLDLLLLLLLLPSSCCCRCGFWCHMLLGCRWLCCDVLHCLCCCVAGVTCCCTSEVSMCCW